MAESLINHSNTSYHLSELRNIKGDRLQYFDHPKLGALLIIKPVDETERDNIQAVETQEDDPQT